MDSQLNEIEAFHHVVLQGNIGEAKRFYEQHSDALKRICQNQWDMNKTPLMVACEYGYEDLVDWLLEIELSDIDAEDFLGDTALMYAVTTARKNVVKKLLERNANVNHVNIRYENVMDRAVNACGNPELLELLLRYEPVADFISCFEYAAMKRSEQIVMILAKRLANVDEKTMGDFGQTALTLAARYNHPSVAHYLLRKGANMYLKNTVGDSALLVASTWGHRDVLDVMCSYESSANPWGLMQWSS